MVPPQLIVQIGIDRQALFRESLIRPSVGERFMSIDPNLNKFIDFWLRAGSAFGKGRREKNQVMIKREAFGTSNQESNGGLSGVPACGPQYFIER